MPSKTPHPLTGQCLHVHGAPVGGYEIPSNGIIHPHDTNGKKLQVFNVGRKVTLLEAAAKLELHIQKCLQQQGEWFLQSKCVPCAKLFPLLPCVVLLSCAEASTPINRSHLPQVPPAAMAIMFSPCRLMNQNQVRSFHSVYQMPRTHRAARPIMRAKRAITLVNNWTCVSCLGR